MKKLLFLLSFSIISVAFAQKTAQNFVYFNTDQYVIPTIEKNRMLLFVSKLNVPQIETIAIYGYCDDVGAPNYNLTLSQNRAEAIKGVFTNFPEISQDLITNVDGKGQILLKIVDEDDILKIRGLNRKVEISVKYFDPPKPLVKTLADENLKIGDKIVLKNVLFKSGYAYPLLESKKVLDKIAKILIDRNDIYFTIQGHVCCTTNSRDAVDKKTKERNLSVARAKYVYNHLLKKGIDSRRMKYVGLRRKFPLGGDPRNDRRVEVLITHIGSKY